VIKSLKIRNFESWENAEINFHPGINILVGESDKGKSGIIRALKLAFQNRPQGFNYRSDFLEDKKAMTSVETVLINENSTDTVIRQRNLSGTNEYLLNGKPLVALRTDVPTEISEVTKMSEINIQGQHPTEQYFLLSERPGYVAKEFNKVSNLEVMDDAISEINSQVRTAKAEEKVIQKEIDTKKQLIKENEWLPKALKFTEKLEGLESDIQDREEELAEIVYLLGQIKSTEQKLKQYKDVSNALKMVKKLIDLNSEILETENKKKKLIRIVSDSQNLRLRLKAMQSIDEALNDLKTLEKQPREIQKEEDLYIELVSIVKSIQKNEEKETELNTEIEKYEKVFHHKLKTEECPTCGRIG
jgi:DNA repair protein SbcC/Rad50